VVDRIRVHCPKQADIVNDPPGMRKEVAQEGAALAVALELVHRGRDGQTILVCHHPGDPLSPEDRGWNVLVESALQFGLVVEQIQMGRPTSLEQEDDSFRPRREIWERPGSSARRPCQKRL
jgi:hypothetical protein